LTVPQAPQIKKALLTPENVCAARRILRVGGSGKIVACHHVKIFPAVLAITHTGTVPAIDEDTVHLVTRHDFPLHLCHKLEVVGTQRTGHPHLRRRPVATWISIRVNRNPIWIPFAHVVVGRVRVGARNDYHAKLSTTCDEIPEHILLTEPGAPMMEG